MDISRLSFNPFTKIGKEWALVGAGTEEKANMMTVSWGGLGVLWGKNVVFAFIRDSRYTKEFIDREGSYSLSFLDESYREALKFCGSRSGRDFDKWKETGLTMAMSGDTPYPKEASLTLICRKMAAIPVEESAFIDEKILPTWYGDHDMHTMYVGEIIEVIGE